MQSLTPNRAAIQRLRDAELLSTTAILYDISVRLCDTTLATTPLFKCLVDEVQDRGLLEHLGQVYARISNPPLPDSP